MKNHDASGSKLVPTPPRNLPNRILRAIDNALHLASLPRALRATLADICRFVPQARPFDTVFAHKEKIAERAGTSERTVYRHLQALRAAGMIEVLAQERKSRNGRFAVSRIRLTQRSAGLLGFIAIADDPFNSDEASSIHPDQAILADQIVKSETQESAATMPVKPVIHSEPSAILSAGHTLSKPTVSKNQPLHVTKNGLPEDLAWLTGNGVSRAGIFKLMALAKSKNKRLSDVVIVVQDYIKDMKGGRLYAYLATLCNGPTDFMVAAAQQRLRISEQKAALVFKRKCQAFRERFKNTALTDRTQTRLYVIDERAAFVQVFGKTPLGSAPLNDLTSWIHGIETGKLVLATLELENRFLNN